MTAPLIRPLACLDWRDTAQRAAEVKAFPSRYPLVNPTPRRGEPTRDREERTRRNVALDEMGWQS